MEEMTKQYVKDVQKKNDELAELERAYKLEELLLTDDLRAQRLQLIKAKDQEAKALQNAIFGSEGELFKSKQAALKPILDEIAKAVEKVVRQKRLDFLFDKANDGLALIYTNPVHDYSDYILEELGLEIDPNLKNKTHYQTKNNLKRKTTYENQIFIGRRLMFGLATMPLQAQVKIGFINADYILSQMPEAKQVKKT